MQTLFPEFECSEPVFYYYQSYHKLPSTECFFMARDQFQQIEREYFYILTLLRKDHSLGIVLNELPY